MIPIFSLTASEYQNQVFQTFAKGKEHALYLYQEWYRQGKNLGSHPAFNNASDLLQNLQEKTDWSFLQERARSDDGNTKKFLLQTDEGLEIETVIIPMQADGTLCISSQIGCNMGCRFCETGRMGLLKNLSVEEIVHQAYYARHVLHASFRNVVFMGMGEPFDNYENVMQAFRVLNDQNGMNIGARHITISTSGRADGIYKLADEEGITPHLAVSITSAQDTLRNKLMPINRKWPLKEIHAAIVHYQQKKRKQVLISYVLLKGVNDSPLHAEDLANFLEGLDVKVNLIPYNAQSQNPYQTPDIEDVRKFQIILQEKGFQVLLRITKGDKIMAACGQLGNLSHKKEKSV